MEIKSLEERIDEIRLYVEGFKHRELIRKEGEFRYEIFEKDSTYTKKGYIAYEDSKINKGGPIYFYSSIYDVMEKFEPLFVDGVRPEPRSTDEVPANINFFYTIFKTMVNNMPSRDFYSSVEYGKCNYYEKTGIYGFIQITVSGKVVAKEIIDKNYSVEKMIKLSKLALLTEEEVDKRMDEIFDYINSIKDKQLNFGGKLSYKRYPTSCFNYIVGDIQITYPEDVSREPDKYIISLKKDILSVKNFLNKFIKIKDNNNMELF